MAAVSSMTMRCRSGGPYLMTSCSPCMNCDPPATAKPGKPQGAQPDSGPGTILSDVKKSQAEAEQRQFQSDLGNLKTQLKGVEVGKENEITLKAATAANMAPPANASSLPAWSESWSPQQCEVARVRVAAYRQALQQTTEVARRLNRAIAADQQLRSEWEGTMSAAVERAKDRGQFLWLALPLGKLSRINKAATDRLDKNAGDLADLLAEATDPVKRDTIRGIRQLNVREKEIVAELGKTYDHIGEALTLGGNAPLMFEDPEESPTSPLQGDAMKLREAGEMLFGLISERDKWKRLAANAPWAKYLTGGLTAAFAAEAAARAMYDSWYDAFASGLAWEQLFTMNLYADRYLEAVQKLGAETQKRTVRLKNAEAEFARQCAKSGK